MSHAVVLLAPLLMLLGQQTSTRPSDGYRDEFRLQPASARISDQFSQDAWIVLLYASRISSTDQVDSSRDARTDVEMEKLRAEVKTDGEWLFWFRLMNYSSAKRSADENQVEVGSQAMLDPNACRSVLMAANRGRVMTASMPACEFVQRSLPTRKP